MPERAEDHRPRRRRDRPGAARAGAARARLRRLRRRARARAPRPVARAPARDAERLRHRGRRGDARGRLRDQGGDDHAGGRRRRRLAQPDPARGGRRQGDRPHRTPDPGRRRPRRGRALPDLPIVRGGRRRLRRRRARARRASTRSRCARGMSRAVADPSGARLGRELRRSQWTAPPPTRPMREEEMDADRRAPPRSITGPCCAATYAGRHADAARRAARDPAPIATATASPTS